MIDRDTYMEMIEPFIGKSIIKILIGVRRAGKSTLLMQVREKLLKDGVSPKNIISLNLESAAYAALNDTAALLGHLQERIAPTGKTYIFLDEIQEVEGWEKVLRSLMVDHDVDLYVTGSNSQLLSSELATFITGRYIEIPVYPFSFSEYLQALEDLGIDTDSRKAFMNYLVQGGFPFQYELEFEQAPGLRYLSDVFNAILLKDVVQRNSIRDSAQLERIVDYAIEQVGHTISTKSLSEYLKSEKRSVSVETIYSYLRASEEACLLYRVKREDAIGKRALKFNEKYYLVDQGIRAARGFSNEEAIDQVLENIVFMELKRRGYEVSVGKVGDKEIDFVARKESSISYYQVCYLLASQDVVEREFGALEEVNDNHPKYVLSLDDIQRSRNGIINLNIIDWLRESE